MFSLLLPHLFHKQNQGGETATSVIEKSSSSWNLLKVKETLNSQFSIDLHFFFLSLSSDTPRLILWFNTTSSFPQNTRTAISSTCWMSLRDIQSWFSLQHEKIRNEWRCCFVHWVWVQFHFMGNFNNQSAWLLSTNSRLESEPFSLQLMWPAGKNNKYKLYIQWFFSSHLFLLQRIGYSLSWFSHQLRHAHSSKGIHSPSGKNGKRRTLWTSHQYRFPVRRWNVPANWRVDWKEAGPISMRRRNSFGSFRTSCRSPTTCYAGEHQSFFLFFFAGSVRVVTIWGSSAEIARSWNGQIEGRRERWCRGRGGNNQSEETKSRENSQRQESEKDDKVRNIFVYTSHFEVVFKKERQEKQKTKIGVELNFFPFFSLMVFFLLFFLPSFAKNSAYFGLSFFFFFFYKGASMLLNRDSFSSWCE